MQAPLLSAALQERFTTGLCHCSYTYEGLLFIQLSSDPTPIHCSTALRKMLSAALQKKSTAGLCHCNYTYEECLSMSSSTLLTLSDCPFVAG